MEDNNSEPSDEQKAEETNQDNINEADASSQVDAPNLEPEESIKAPEVPEVTQAPEVPEKPEIGEPSNEPSASLAATDSLMDAPTAVVSKTPHNIKKILLFALTAIVVLVLALGVGTYLYHNKLNKDVAAARTSATYVDHITVAYSVEPLGYYPEAIGENTTVNYYGYYYEGLTSFNKNMEIQPQLALSWENPDTNTWRFRLRNDVKFHNGQKMTADDVVASYEMAIADGNINVAIPTVQSVTKVDDYTVDIKTSAATPILVNLLPQINILPKTLIESKDWSHPVGTGPYKLVSVKGSDYSLVRNDDYYGAKPKVAKVTLTSIVSDEERLAAVKSGKVDVAIEYTPVPKDAKTANGKLIKYAVSQPIDAIYLTFDSVRDKSPYITGVTTNPFKDLRVRQAVSLALNVPDIINGGDYPVNSQQATQIVPPSIFGYNSDIKPTVQDVAKAKTLMKEAGYTNGFTVVFDTAGQQVNFQRLLKEQLAAINITVNVKYNDPSLGSYFSKLMDGDTSMLCMSWTTPSGDALEAYENVLGAGGIANFFKINDPDINNLISQARSATDLSKRKDYLKQLAVVADQKKYTIPLVSEAATFDYRDGLVVTPRADGLNYAAETSGAVPSNLKDYSYLDTVKKIFHR